MVDAWETCGDGGHFTSVLDADSRGVSGWSRGVGGGGGKKKSAFSFLHDSMTNSELFEYTQVGGRPIFHSPC